MHLSYTAFTDAIEIRINIEKETVLDDSQFNLSSSSLTLPVNCNNNETANCNNNDNQSNSTVRQKNLLQPVVHLTHPSISKTEQTLSSLVGKYHA